MRTSKPVSTISYNTQPFLELKLKELLERRLISDYMYIYHFAEKDERKNHVHLWIKPNKLIDTMALQSHFMELVIGQKKPLGCIDFRSSKVDDWILYNQHYKPYLQSKGEKREFEYSKEDFYYADEDTFEYNYAHAFKASDWANRSTVLKEIARGDVKPYDMLVLQRIPLERASNLSAMMLLKREYQSDLRKETDDSTGHDTGSQDAQA